jgi:transcriptional antiterminator
MKKKQLGDELKAAESRSFQEVGFLLDLKALSQFLSVSRKTLLRMHQDGEIRLYRLRGKLVAKRDEILEAIDKGLLEPA